MANYTNTTPPDVIAPNLFVGQGRARFQKAMAVIGHGFLLLITSASALAILFIFFFIIRDALPFFRIPGAMREFFTSARWSPSAENPEFGVLAIFAGSALVTAGAALFATPLGIVAAVCLSDVLPFSMRQVAKPVIEILAAIPSVAYGFFAFVVFAPLLQEHGGLVLTICLWGVGGPLAGIVAFIAGDLISGLLPITGRLRLVIRWGLSIGCFSAAVLLGVMASGWLLNLQIHSGVNALNVSIILGIMALPTIVSVSEDALTAVGRDLREGSYALGSTRAETLCLVVIPAAASGILAAVLLGIMRAIGETMVVWMASGNAAQIPTPWYNYLAPVKTLTATIAGEMGEADHITGSARYHVLFAMGLCLLVFSFLCNLVSEFAIRRSKRKSA